MASTDAMPNYPDAQRVREARERYFAENDLGDGGYTARWVPLQMGPIPFRIPNTAGRVRAVRLHDVHHLVTGYATDWVGEGEIAAWELASGCRDHYAAWVLNLSAAGIAFWLAPRRVARAFRRGWRRRNLYVAEWDERLLDETLGALRERLGVPSGGEVHAHAGQAARAPLASTAS